MSELDVNQSFDKSKEYCPWSCLECEYSRVAAEFQMLTQSTLSCTWGLFFPNMVDCFPYWSERAYVVLLWYSSASNVTML